MSWILKKLSTKGGAWGNEGTILISSWKCDFSIYLDIQIYHLDIQVCYLDIQAISTLLCLLFIHTIMPSTLLCLLFTLLCLLHFYAFYSWCVIINFFYNSCHKKCSREKSCLWSLQSLLLLQFSTYWHRTGFIVKRKRVHTTNYFGMPINVYFIFFQIFEVFILPKEYALFKNFLKIYYSFFFQNW